MTAAGSAGTAGDRYKTAADPGPLQGAALIQWIDGRRAAGIDDPTNAVDLGNMLRDLTRSAVTDLRRRVQDVADHYQARATLTDGQPTSLAAAHALDAHTRISRALGSKP